MRTKGFTLIELLVIIGIMAAMVTVGVVGLNSSRATTRLFGAGRDVMAMIRRARSLALVTQKPVVITYSNESADGESYAKVEITADRIFKSKKNTEAVQNLAGETVIEAVVDDGEESSGETLEDVLSPESIPLDVVKGLKIKVLDESDQLQLPENEKRRSKISIFSTADNVSRTLNAGEGAGPGSAAGETHTALATAFGSSASPRQICGTEGDGSESAADEATEEPFAVAFAVNGTVNPPHRIWIYREESSPEKGICIHVDRFGEPKCEDFQ